MVYSGCGNRNCGLADTAGLDRVLARRLLHRRRGDEAARQVRRRPEHPDAWRRSSAVRRGPEGGGPGRRTASTSRSSTPPPVLGADSLRRPGRHADPRRGRRRIRRRLRRQRPSARARRLAAGDEVSWSRSWAPTSTPATTTATPPLHHAAARGDNEMILYLVSQGRRRHRRGAQRPDDGRHGQRSGAARLAVPRHRGAAREAGEQEQPALRLVLSGARGSGLGASGYDGNTKARSDFPPGLSLVRADVVTACPICPSPEPQPR